MQERVTRVIIGILTTRRLRTRQQWDIVVAARIVRTVNRNDRDSIYRFNVVIVIIIAL